MIQMENSSTTSALRLFPQHRNSKSHPYLPNVDLVAESSGSRSVVREDRRPVAVPVGVDQVDRLATGCGLQTMLQRDLVEGVHCHHTEYGAKYFLRVSFHAWVHP